MVSASAWVNHTTKRRVAQSESGAQQMILEARTVLLSDTDPDTRIAEALSLASSSIQLLESSTESPWVARILTAVLRSSALQPIPSASISLRARALYSSLSETATALPALRRLAGYDASADIRAAVRPQDLYIRLYLARDGLRKTIDTLGTPPPSVHFDASRLAIASAEQAYTETGTLIRQLEINPAGMPDTSRFLASSRAATQHATRAVEQLLSEEYLQSLAGLAQ